MEARSVFRASSAFPLSSAMFVSGCALFGAEAIAWDGMAWVAVLAVLLAAIPRRVVIGAEGLQIAWLGRGRIIRYEDVRRAEPEGPEGVTLTLASGETLRLARGAFDATSPRDVLERIWHAATLGADGRVRPNERLALGRRDRDAEAWLRGLRALSSPGAEYRRGILSSDRLVAIATNPTVEVELRSAAVVAYACAGGGLDEATSEELRMIAELTVDETLREVFVRVASARDESDLLSALREAA